MTAPKSPKFRISPELVLSAGKYLKVGTRRISKAFIEIGPEGDLTYVNSESLATPITVTTFQRYYEAGYATPADGASLTAKPTKAPRA